MTPRRPHRWRARVLGRRTLLHSPYFRVVEESVSLSGKRFTYQFRPHGGVVHVVALTPKHEVILVRQYRHPVRRALLELPAGKVNARESALAGAKRELLEETGYGARRWVALGRWYPSPASTNMKSCFFLALDARRVRAARLERYEFLRLETRSFADLTRRFAGMRDVPLALLVGVALAERWLRDHRSRA